MVSDSEKIEALFPHIVGRVSTCRYIGNDEYIIELKDGDMILCDCFEKTYRLLPQDCRDMNEQECRSEFGLRLRKLLTRKHITQKDLSESTGINQVIISRYISGKVSPSFYNVDKIAKALNCSMDDLRYC